MDRTALRLIAGLRAQANPRDARILQGFFKTGPGEYGEGDVFLGIRMPALRALVKEHRRNATLAQAEGLLASPLHEARMLGLLLMVEIFQRGDEDVRHETYASYMTHRSRINNWDLVDLSAPHIVGAWLFTRDRRVLNRLARSRVLWERRIAVLSTFQFIRRGDFADTLRLCERLLADPHDLMHKACGWMLREVGKRDAAALRGFLDRHAGTMPRTMLRYAIEKLGPRERRRWLSTTRR